MDVDFRDEELRRMLSRFKTFFGAESEALLERLGFFAETQILTRTIEGKDADGAAFEGYAPSTIRYRQAKGRQTSKVNLFFSGRMQGLVTHKVKKGDQVRVYIASGFEAMYGAAHHFGRGRVPERRWFDLNDDDIQRIHDMAETAIARFMED